MYRVLMPVDGDVDRALAQAAYVTSLPEASNAYEVILLFVFHGEGEEMPPELAEFNTAKRVDAVQRAQEHLEEHGVEVDIHGDSGDTAADILREADEYDVDEIVLGTRKRSPAGKAIFGSVTQSVYRETDRPVVMVGGSQD